MNKINFKKWGIAGVVCGMLLAGGTTKTFAAPPYPLEAVVIDVIAGAFDRPYYDQPYYFYNGRYYYGGVWRNGHYYYKGRKLRHGRFHRHGRFYRDGRYYNHGHRFDRRDYRRDRDRRDFKKDYRDRDRYDRH